MNPIKRFAKWIGKGVKATTKAVSRRIRGSYDAAQSSAEFDDYWAWSDSLNANAANSPEVRKTLRERARYQRDNDGHMRGLIERIARDLVGSGPRLQILLPDSWTDPDFQRKQTTPPDAARRIEKLFHEWCRTIGLARKLRILHQARLVDGECFGRFITNPMLPSAGPRLDIRLYETDQVDTPFFYGADPQEFPGGRLDEAGNVIEWHLLKVHPGSNVWALNTFDFDTVPASRMIHWVKSTRPGQLRGIPEVAAGLPLYAYLRRYTLAVLGSAETAAKIAGVLEIDAPPPADDGTMPPVIADMDEVSIPRGALLTTYGKVSQLKAEQPTTQYQQFRGEVLTEAGAGLGATRSQSTSSSAEYNFSSARMDNLPYERMVGIERGDLREIALDPLFREWVRECSRIAGYLPDGLPPFELWSWEWHFDGFDSIDPLKDAKTDETNLAIGATTLAEIYGRKGKDWEESMRQRAREVDLANELGLTAMYSISTATNSQTDENGEEVADSNAGSAAGAGGVQSTALNGAQITSLLMLADKVVLKQYPADAATALVQAAFPLMSRTLIDRFVKGLVSAPKPEPEAVPDGAEQTAAA